MFDLLSFNSEALKNDWYIENQWETMTIVIDCSLRQLLNVVGLEFPGYSCPDSINQIYVLAKKKPMLDGNVLRSS